MYAVMCEVLLANAHVQHILLPSTGSILSYCYSTKLFMLAIIAYAQAQCRKWVDTCRLEYARLFIGACDVCRTSYIIFPWLGTRP